MPLVPEDIARITHEANRALQAVQGDPAVPVAPPWDDFPYAEQLVVIEGVGHALKGATPRELHESWRYAKERDGWSWGPVKNSAAKLHPCLVPYDDLPEGQRIKDDLFAAVVDALGEVAAPPLDVTGRHPGTVDLMRWLTPNPHLSGAPATIAASCRVLAELLVDNLDDGPELTAGLRKLLEAKDCFVRAGL